mmetsp:Transcript_39002/g.63765  ORF Transcript_39002/g.63765 Transcript_39002/m.63765 type:complete len:154 (+) Transcript_39002:37-498(+)
MSLSAMSENTCMQHSCIMDDSLSALAVFQSVVYSNHRLAFKEQHTFDVVQHIQTLDHVQRAVNAMNRCQHSCVTSKAQQTKDMATYTIACDDCGSELYNCSHNKNPTSLAPKQLLRKNEKWYHDIYLRCSHPKSHQENIVCKQCGRATHFVLH